MCYNSGQFMCFQQAGCSLTLSLFDDELLALWDAQVVTPALRWGG